MKTIAAWRPIIDAAFATRIIQAACLPRQTSWQRLCGFPVLAWASPTFMVHESVKIAGVVPANVTPIQRESLSQFVVSNLEKTLLRERNVFFESQVRVERHYLQQHRTERSHELKPAISILKKTPQMVHSETHRASFKLMLKGLNFMMISGKSSPLAELLPRWALSMPHTVVTIAVEPALIRREPFPGLQLLSARSDFVPGPVEVSSERSESLARAGDPEVLQHSLADSGLQLFHRTLGGGSSQVEQVNSNPPTASYKVQQEIMRRNYGTKHHIHTSGSEAASRDRVEDVQPQLPAIDMNLLVGQVYRTLERKMRIERERRGQ